MKIERNQLYLIGGIGMLVGSFFAAAQALGGVVALIYFFAATDFRSIEPSAGQNLKYSVITGNVNGAIYGVASFLILFFGARWLISGPRIIDRWIDRGRLNRGESDNRSEQAAAPNHSASPIPTSEPSV